MNVLQRFPHEDNFQSVFFFSLTTCRSHFCHHNTIFLWLLEICSIQIKQHAFHLRVSTSGRLKVHSLQERMRIARDRLHLVYDTTFCILNTNVIMIIEFIQQCVITLRLLKDLPFSSCQQSLWWWNSLSAILFWVYCNAINSRISELQSEMETPIFQTVSQVRTHTHDSGTCGLNFLICNKGCKSHLITNLIKNNTNKKSKKIERPWRTSSFLVWSYRLSVILH